jgi:hypothetical protein
MIKLRRKKEKINQTITKCFTDVDNANFVCLETYEILKPSLTYEEQQQIYSKLRGILTQQHNLYIELFSEGELMNEKK